MLQLTRAADYALRLLVEVGSHGDGPIATAEAARRHEIPYQFLRKIVQTLVARGLLVSERGLHGGLSLARPAESITMLEILQAFSTPALNRCTAEPPDCDRRHCCAVFPVWVRAQKELERLFSRVTLSDLVRAQRALERAARRRHPAQGAAPIEEIVRSGGEQA